MGGLHGGGGVLCFRDAEGGHPKDGELRFLARSRLVCSSRAACLLCVSWIHLIQNVWTL